MRAARLLALAGSLALPAEAAAPRLINYQGKLADASGSPLTGTYSFRFRVFDAASGGNLLFSEQLDGGNAVSVVNGIYTVELGAVSGGLPESAFLGDAAYLELDVAAGTSLASAETLSPRERIVSVGYAFRALAAEKLGLGAVISTYTSAGDLLLPGGIRSSTHAFVGLGSAPAGAAGTVYYDSGSNRLRLHTGSGYEDILTGAQYPSNVMTTDGAQAVTGVKTFSADPVFNSNAIPDAAVAALSASKLTGTLPASALSGTYPNALTFGSTGSGPVAFATHTVLGFAQLRLGNFAGLPGPGEAGPGSLVYNSSDGAVYFSDGSGWSAFATAAVSPWTESAGSVRLVNGASRVGVGTASPAEKLHVAGNILSEAGVVAATGSFSTSLEVASSPVLTEAMVGTGPGQLVRLDGSSRLPALDGSLLLRVSSVAAGAVQDASIVGVSGSKVSGDIAGAAALNVLKAGDSMTGPLDMTGQRVTSLGAPAAGSDAATRDYVDAATGGLGAAVLSATQTFTGQNTFTAQTTFSSHVVVTQGDVQLPAGSIESAEISSLDGSKIAGNIPGAAALNVLKAGDAMTGGLTLSGSTLTVGGSAFSVGGSTLAVGDGSIGVGTTLPASKLHVLHAPIESVSLLRVTNYAGQILDVNSNANALLNGTLTITPGGTATRALHLQAYGAGQTENIFSVTDKSLLAALDVSPSGNLGLGRADPGSTRLWVQGGAGVDYHLRVSSQDATAGLLVVDRAGRVGFGTASPQASVHLSGLTPTLRIEGTTGGGHVLDLTADPTVGTVLRNQGSLLPLTFRMGLSDRMTLTNAGSLGIGTTDPSTLLHVAGAGKFEGALDMSGQRVTSLGAPLAGSDAATKDYVDSATGGGNAAVLTATQTFTGQNTFTAQTTFSSHVIVTQGDVQLPADSIDSTEINSVAGSKVAGNIPGAAALNVLKAGDTMTGALLFDTGADELAVAAGRSGLDVSTSLFVAGRIGVGTTAPGARLQIETGQGGADALVLRDTTSASSARFYFTSPVGSPPDLNISAGRVFFPGVARFSSGLELGSINATIGQNLSPGVDVFMGWGGGQRVGDETLPLDGTLMVKGRGVGSSFDRITVVAYAPPSETKDVMQWRTAAGSILGAFTSTGTLGLGTSTPSNDVRLDVEGAAQFGQGAAKSTFSATGELTFPPAYSPGSGQSAATKAYVDAATGGLGAAVLSATQTFTGQNTFTAQTTFSSHVIVTEGSVQLPADSIDSSEISGLAGSKVAGDIPGAAALNVLKTGDVMTGGLTLSGSTLTVGGGAFSVGGSTLVVANGRVGVGTAGPAVDLHVAGPSARLRVQDTVTGSRAIQIDPFNVRIESLGGDPLMLRSNIDGTLVSLGAGAGSAWTFESFNPHSMRGLTAPGQPISFGGQAGGASEGGASSVSLFTSSAVFAAAVERLRISNLGNVGIGTTAPGASRLWVQGGAAADYHLRVSSQDSTGSLLVLDRQGRLGVGLTGPTALLHVAGTGKFDSTLDMSGQRVTSLGAPLAGSDAATRDYVDSATGGGNAAVVTATQTFTGQNTFTAETTFTSHVFVTQGSVQLPADSIDSSEISSLDASKVAGNIPGAAALNVLKAGDVMTGGLTLSGSTLTVGGSAFSVGGSTFVVEGGRVGVGAASPAYPLVIQDDGAATAAVRVNKAGGVAGQYALWATNSVAFGGWGARAASVGSSGNKVGVWGEALNAGTNYGLYGDASGGTTNWGLYVNSGDAYLGDGRVGVGAPAPLYRLHVSSGPGEAGILFAVSTGAAVMAQIRGTGEIIAAKFIGDGSLLTGVTGTDATKVLKAGDVMTGGLTLSGSTLTVGGGAFSVGGSTFVVGSGLVGIGTTSPQSPLEVVGDLRASSRAAFGGDAAFGAGRIFDLSHTITDFSEASTWLPLHSVVTLDPSVNLTGGNAKYVYSPRFRTRVPNANSRDFESIAGLDGLAVHEGSGLVNTLIGGWLGTSAPGSGSIGTIFGLLADALRSGTGSVVTNYGLYVRTGHLGTGGSITTDYGIFVQSPFTSRPITTHYGLYLQNQAVAPTSYAIYADGGRTYLKDALGIGTTDPTARLSVHGTGSSYTMLVSTSASGTPPALLVTNGGRVVVGAFDLDPTSRFSVGHATMSAAALFLNDSYLEGGSGDWGVRLAGIDNGSNGHDLRIQTRDTASGAFADALTVRSSGRVGIGAINPQNMLDVSGSAAFGAYANQFAAPVNGLIVSGSVGIGTSVPQSKLHVVDGDIRISTTSGSSGIVFQDGSILTSASGLGSPSTMSGVADVTITADSDQNATGSIVFLAGSLEHARFANDGRLGIGTASPSARLDVRAGPAEDIALFRNLSGVAVATITATGQFAGDGSLLTNVSATDNTKVLKSGDAMTGPLTLAGSSLTVNGAVETSTLTVRSGSFIASGTIGGLPVSGAGTRLMWIPSLAAIRGGAVTGSQWDSFALAPYSVAFGYNNQAGSQASTVAGGEGNTVAGNYGAIGGGINNSAIGNMTTIGGGQSNSASMIHAAVGGGDTNTASGSAAVVAGGVGNTASGSRASIGGGYSNTASGTTAMIPGGSQNAASGDYSLAAGRQAKATAQGSFVWADSQGADLTATVTDQFRVRAQGGFYVDSSSVSFVSGGSTRLFVQSDGRVGVGTTSPLVQLDVRGGLDVRNDGWSHRGLDSLGNIRGGLIVAGSAPNTRGQMSLMDITGTARVLFDAAIGGSSFLLSGKLGIGTSSPGSALDVAGDAQFGSGATKSTFTALGDLVVGGTLTVASGLVSLPAGAIDTTELADGTVLFGDWSDNGCSSGQIAKWNGLAWACAADLTASGPATAVSSNTDVLIDADDDLSGAGSIQLRTANSPRLTVLNGGNVGVGTADPAALLQVGGGTLTATSSGRVGIGTTSPAALLEVFGGQALLSDGSLGAPGLAFAGSPDTGLMLSGGKLFAVVDGALPFALTNQERVEFNTGGTAASPVLNWNLIGADGNTGIFHPAMDTLAFSTNGTERMRFDAGGSVGIGTTQPAATLEAARPDAGDVFLGTGPNASQAVINVGEAGGPVYMGAKSSSELRLVTGGATRLRIGPTGGVAIATSAASYSLHVSTGPGESGTVLAVSTGSIVMAEIKGTGEIVASKFTGDGSGLTNVSATDGTKVLKAGDTMAGALAILGSSLTVLDTNVADAYSLVVGTGASAQHLLVSTSGVVSHQFGVVSAGLGYGTTVGAPRGVGATDLQTYRAVATEVASGPSSAIAGGRRNTASGDAAAVGGGISNAAVGSFATIGGGSDNIANGGTSVIAGGLLNQTAQSYASVGGGISNQAGGYAATVGGGSFNSAGGQYAAVPGGASNSASGSYSLAAGRQAKATAQGSFVWADSQAADLTATVPDQFRVRAQGGFYVDSSSVTLVNGGATNLLVDASGGVALSTANAAYRLHVSTGPGESGTVLAVSTGSTVMVEIKGTGEIVASKFTGDGSGLTGVSATDGAKVAKIGDTMTGTLTFDTASSELTVASGRNGIDIATSVFVTSGNLGIASSSPNAKLTVGNGQIAAPDGTAAQPAYSFGTDLGLGIFKTVNTLQFAISGTGVLSLSSGFLVGQQVLRMGSGTAAAPSYSFGGNVDNGMFSPGTDLVALASAGAERLRVDSSGNVGIATTSPSGLFQVGGGTLTALASGNVGVGTTDPAALFQVGGGTLTATASGRVGIGTTSPAARLDVLGSAAESLTLRVTTSPGTYHLVVTPAGYVGVGTSSPALPLVVEERLANFKGQLKVGTGGSYIDCGSVTCSNFAATGTLYAGGATNWLGLVDGTLRMEGTPGTMIAGGSGTTLYSNATSSRTVLLMGDVAGWKLLVSTGTSDASSLLSVNRTGEVGIGTTDPAALFQVGGGTLTATAAGRVGIGTTSPAATLQVFGGQALVSDGSLGAPGLAFAGSPDTGFMLSGGKLFAVVDGLIPFALTNQERVEFNTAGSAASPVLNWNLTGADGNTGIFHPGMDTLGFATDGAERLRIGPSGGVAIATSAASFSLHVSTGPGESGTVLAVSTGSTVMVEVKGTGEVVASKFTGDGSGLTGVSATDGTKVLKAGDTMTGTLTFDTASSELAVASGNGIDVSTNLFVAGRLGVGVASTSEKFEFTGGNARLNGTVIVGTSGGGWGGQPVLDVSNAMIYLEGTPSAMGWGGSTTGLFNHAGSLRTRFIIGDTAGWKLVISTAGSDASGLMTVQRDGNVGIATTSPAAKLDVAGDAQFGSGAVRSTFTALGDLVVGGTLTVTSGLVALPAGAIDTTELADATILFADWSDNGCALGQIAKRSGAGWACATDETAAAATSVSSNTDVMIDADSDFDASGAIYLRTAETPRLTVLNGGNVGVGTTNPTALFQVGGGTLTVTSSGRVGVGTTSLNPIAALHVARSAAGIGVYTEASGPTGNNFGIDAEAVGPGANQNTAGLFWAEGASANRGIEIGAAGNAGADDYAIYSNIDSKIYLNGRVGLGTTNPGTARLWVQGGGSDSYHLRVSSQDSTGSLLVIDRLGQVSIGTQPTSGYALHVAGRGLMSRLVVEDSSPVVQLANLDPDDVRTFSMRAALIGGSASAFSIRDEFAGQYRFVIDNNGWVGIGTTRPSSFLSLEGSFDRTFEVGEHSSGAGRALTVKSGNAYVDADADGGNLMLLGGNAASFSFVPQNGGDVYISGGSSAGGGSDGDVALAHNGIFKKGKVGIGTAAPGYLLHIKETRADYAGYIENSTDGNANGLFVTASDSTGDDALTIGFASNASGGASNYAVRGDAFGGAGSTNYGLWGNASGGVNAWGLYVASGNSRLAGAGGAIAGAGTPTAKLEVVSASDNAVRLRKTASTAGSVDLFPAIADPGGTQDGMGACLAVSPTSLCLAFWTDAGAPAICSTMAASGRALCADFGD